MKIKFSNKLFNRLLIGVLGLSIVVFFVVMVEGLSILSSKSRQLVNLKVQSETADAQLANLEQTKKDVVTYSFFKTVAQTVIPNDKDQAEAVYEINQMATQAGFKLKSITFPTSSLGAAAAAAAATTAAGHTSPSPSLTTSSLNAISQAKPVTGIAGLYGLELTITSDTSKTLPVSEMCTYPKVIDFLQQIEKNRRTAQITDVTIEPSADSPALNLSLTINVFIKP